MDAIPAACECRDVAENHQADATSSDDQRPTDPDVYRAAHELLSKLADVARALPTGLDEVSLARNLLDRIDAITPFERAAVYVVSDAGRLLQLTIVGADQLRWQPGTLDSGWGHLARSGRWQVECPAAAHGAAPTVAALLPASLGGEGIALVVIETDGNGWDEPDLDAAEAAVDEAALQLDSGRLFSDIRALATTEERRRLAREIHDGIAQEIASLGYAADAIAAQAEDPEVAKLVRGLRDEVSRIVNELRLSIFDLRSDVQWDTGLAAALSSHVRQVGASSDMTVHMILDESSRRLSVGAETELLRIAQEAITNARRHAEARNLWVSCRVHPPTAFLRIADDGKGLGSRRVDSYGLEIMRERASRLGAHLVIRAREDGGTVVEVTLGPPED